MNITVCIKRTPETDARVRIRDDAMSIDPAGVKYIVSPYDEFAIEAALQTRDQAGEGEVTVVSLGEPAASEQLVRGLAMGADRAVLLLTDEALDGYSTARALASELESDQAPLVLFGVKASDSDQQMVGPMVATFLDRPCVTSVSEFEVAGGCAVCHREVEGGVEVVDVDLPAVLTITKGAFEPRYPSLKGIMAAKRKPLEEREVPARPARVRLERLEYPPQRPEGRVVGRGPEAVAELVRLLREEARAL